MPFFFMRRRLPHWGNAPCGLPFACANAAGGFACLRLAAQIRLRICAAFFACPFGALLNAASASPVCALRRKYGFAFAPPFSLAPSGRCSMRRRLRLFAPCGANTASRRGRAGVRHARVCRSSALLCFASRRFYNNRARRRNWANRIYARNPARCL